MRSNGYVNGPISGYVMQKYGSVYYADTAYNAASTNCCWWKLRANICIPVLSEIDLFAFGSYCCHTTYTCIFSLFMSHDELDATEFLSYSCTKNTQFYSHMWFPELREFLPTSFLARLS